MNTVILGAGITGLAAGIKTEAPIYEATDKPGGICRSYYKDGYRFENGGGHWIFGESAFKNILKEYSPMKSYERNAGIYINKILPYPIQSIADKQINPGSMKAWMRHKFGEGLCGVFFDPFNEKYTAGYYNSVIQGDPGKSPDPKKPAGYNSEFIYPEAGLDHLIDQLAENNTIHYNKRAVEINTNLKQKLRNCLIF